MKNSEFVTNWVLDTVKSDYKDDIALVLSHTALRIDDEFPTVSYFVPVTDRGREFAQTFILEGEGFDIWGIEWEQLEKFADLQEYNITCLADATILYAKAPEDAARFYALQQRQRDNLANPETMRKNALEAYAQARQIFLQSLFAEPCDARMGAAYVLDYLAQSIAFSNRSFFHKSQIDQLAELATMKQIPGSFADLYRQVLEETDVEKQKKLLYTCIQVVQSFLEEQAPSKAPQQSQPIQMLSDWYAELSYTWLRIRHYTAQNDRTKVYMWGSMLQEELNAVSNDFGTPKYPLMEAYDPDDLPAFAAFADTVEEKVREFIKMRGGVLKEYRTQEEFLSEI